MCVRISIPRKVQFYEIFGLQRQPGYWIRAMFLEPCRYDFDVKDCAFGCADGVGEGLERSGAEVERETLE
jgi:hypothetical protein